MMYLKSWLPIISSILILLGCGQGKNETPESSIDSLSEVIDDHGTKKDSIFKVIESLNPDSISESDNESIHNVLDNILQERLDAIAKLDSMDQVLTSLEENAILYARKKKENKKLKRQLLREAEEIKKKLETFKPRRLKEIIHKPLPNNLNTLEGLEPGQYRTRLDKRHILKIYVDDSARIFIGNPILDSTTIFKGKPLHPKIMEQIMEIKKKLMN